MSSLMQDLRFALRSLARTPGFTATVAYDNGTADVTLHRTGTATVATASSATTATSQPTAMKHSRSLAPVGVEHAASLASGGGASYAGHGRADGPRGGNHHGGKRG